MKWGDEESVSIVTAPEGRFRVDKGTPDRL